MSHPSIPFNGVNHWASRHVFSFFIPFHSFSSFFHPFCQSWSQTESECSRHELLTLSWMKRSGSQFLLLNSCQPQLFPKKKLPLFCPPTHATLSCSSPGSLRKLQWCQQCHNLRISTSFYLLWYTGPIDKMSRGGTLDKLMMLMNDACHHPDFLFDIESPCLMLELVHDFERTALFRRRLAKHTSSASGKLNLLSNLKHDKNKIQDLACSSCASGQGLNFGSWDSKKLQSRGKPFKVQRVTMSMKGWWKDDEIC